MTESRVYLRPVARKDRDAFLSAMRLSAPLHRPWIDPPTSPEGFRRYLKRMAREDHLGLLAIDRETEAIAGCFNLNNIIRGSFLSASLGYYAVLPFAGRGYMSEGLRLVMAHAFGKLGLHRLEANIQPKNKASIALVKRCGFRKEGFSPAYLFIAGAWRDHERWACLDPRRALAPSP